MKAYFISFFTAALVATIVGILTPDGAGDIRRPIRFLSTLVLLCALLLPLRGFLSLLSAPDDLWSSLPGLEDSEDNYQKELEEALSGAERAYFADMLAQALTQRFSLPIGEVRCRVEWQENEATATPSRVTVILSGSSVWKDPSPIEEYVEALLHCTCVTAIE